MASTGCGKTLANGRICYALADPDRGTRFTIALGLRTLTLQTGSAYRRDLNLSSDDLAIRVGGQASRRHYFEHREAELDAQGRSSAEPLFDADSYVHFDGQIDQHPLLSRVAESPHARSLITAPILVCTIDHLCRPRKACAAVARFPPMLRLMGADLVLDEPDDFGMDDMPALCRLVYWAGLLGSRVLLSSATLPPAMVEGLFAPIAPAGRSSRKIAATRASRSISAAPGSTNMIGNTTTVRIARCFARNTMLLPIAALNALAQDTPRRRARYRPYRFHPPQARGHCPDSSPPS